jgi:replicative DNA helicase
VFIDDTATLTVLEMRAKCRRLEAELGLSLVVVDYMQLMSGRGRFENRTQEISSISRGLKALAKELHIPVIAISQLSRAPEHRSGDHRPQLSDLRESGSIEQDADVVAFIFRSEMYKDPDSVTEEERNRAELIIAKQRNGPTGKIHLAFRRQFTRFDTIDRRSEEEVKPATCVRCPVAGGTSSLSPIAGHRSPVTSVSSMARRCVPVLRPGRMKSWVRLTPGWPWHAL